MKKFAIAMLLAGIGLIGVSPTMAGATVTHCPGHNVAPNVKDESGSNDNDLVVAAGTRICVKAGTGNTGIIVADGTTTLQNYLKAAGIVGGDGEGRNVSYWVTYPPIDEPVLVSAFVCFEGEIHTFGPDVQADVDADVAAFLAANEGAEEVDSADSECVEETTTTTQPETTTTTQPEVTTTTAPVVTTTTQPVVTTTTAAPVVTPTTAAPVAAPVAAPAAPTTLPHTGAPTTFLAMLGAGLAMIGSSLKLLTRRVVA